PVDRARAGAAGVLGPARRGAGPHPQDPGLAGQPGARARLEGLRLRAAPGTTTAALTRARPPDHTVQRAGHRSATGDPGRPCDRRYAVAGSGSTPAPADPPCSAAGSEVTTSMP